MSKEWQQVGTVEEFAATDRKMVDLGGEHQVGVFHVDGEFYATSIWCSHQKASIMTGEVDDAEIMCPLHGARFNLATGQALSLPATRPIKTYPVKVDGDKILVKV